MVNLGEDGKPKAHGKTEIEFVKIGYKVENWLKK
jgi:hypothetical protein